MEEMIDEVKTAEATLRYARISARKVKIVADLIRGKNVDEALAIVKFTPKAASEMLEKLLKSAIANAENNHAMDSKNLYIAEIYANQGPTLKRIRPAAKGSAVSWGPENPHALPRICKESKAKLGSDEPSTSEVGPFPIFVQDRPGL